MRPGPVTREHQDRECGSASVLVLGLAMVLGVVALLCGALGAVAVTRHRAAAAADLSALAAAAQALSGPAASCAAAQEVAELHAARLISCALVGDVVDVVVEVRPGGRLGELGAARVRARAGPAALS